MKNYFKIMLGPKSIYAEECLKNNFIGADQGIRMNLSNELSDDWKEFNHKFIPIYLKNNPGKSKIAAGLGCGALWTVCKGIAIGDIVLCPDGHKRFIVGEVTGGYEYFPENILPHRRSVKWYSNTIKRSEISQEFRNSTNSQGTSSLVTKHAKEIESFISGSPVTIIVTDETIEDPSTFALEKHLEDFLVQNWKQTELAKDFDIYEEDGEVAGQQYMSDTGPIDILAISKDKMTLLVIELKKGRASDSVIGQIQRYMGYVQEELAEDNQSVKGVIIALDDDIRIRRALLVTKNIDFYRYQVSFKLFKG